MGKTRSIHIQFVFCRLGLWLQYLTPNLSYRRHSTTIFHYNCGENGCQIPNVFPYLPFKTVFLSCIAEPVSPLLYELVIWSMSGSHIDFTNALRILGNTASWWDATRQVTKSVYLTQYFDCKGMFRPWGTELLQQHFALRKPSASTKHVYTDIRTVEKNLQLTWLHTQQHKVDRVF